MKQDMPFVSFCIKCYNQAHLIGEALAGAFEQTYPNMEIVISDDASTDGSVNVIKKLVEEYRSRGGAFPVKIIENKTNLGNGGNWQKLCSVAKGEWFVKADGDDRSLPTRVEELMRCWIDGGRKATCIGSDAILVDLKGRSLGPVRRRVLQTNRIAGCVAAYHRCTYDVFGPVKVKESTDDGVYGPRAEMLGPTAYVEKPLVLYRVGDGASRGVYGVRARRHRNFTATHFWLDQWEIDVAFMNQRWHDKDGKCSEMNVSIDNWRKNTAQNIAMWCDERKTRVDAIMLRSWRNWFSINGIYMFALLMPNLLCDIILDFVNISHLAWLRIKYGEKLTPYMSGHQIYNKVLRYRIK